MFFRGGDYQKLIILMTKLIQKFDDYIIIKGEKKLKLNLKKNGFRRGNLLHMSDKIIIYLIP